MFDTVGRYLAGMSDAVSLRALAPIVSAIGDRYSTQPLTSAGLVIKAGGGVLVKTGAAAFYAIVRGSLVTIAASTDMPALTGINITAANFNVVCFYVDAAGVVTVAAGTQAATLGAVKFPEPPRNKALVGFLIITYASTFTGNTTALDTATTVYVSPVGGGAFDATVIV